MHPGHLPDCSHAQQPASSQCCVRSTYACGCRAVHLETDMKSFVPLRSCDPACVPSVPAVPGHSHRAFGSKSQVKVLSAGAVVLQVAICTSRKARRGVMEALSLAFKNKYAEDGKRWAANAKELSPCITSTHEHGSDSPAAADWWEKPSCCCSCAAILAASCSSP